MNQYWPLFIPFNFQHIMYILTLNIEIQHHIKLCIVHKKFYVETQDARKPWNYFLISNKYYIHFIYENQQKGGCNTITSLEPTVRRH